MDSINNEKLENILKHAIDRNIVVIDNESKGQLTHRLIRLVSAIARRNHIEIHTILVPAYTKIESSITLGSEIDGLLVQPHYIIDNYSVDMYEDLGATLPFIEGIKCENLVIGIGDKDALLGAF